MGIKRRVLADVAIDRIGQFLPLPYEIRQLPCGTALQVLEGMDIVVAGADGILGVLEIIL